MLFRSQAIYRERRDVAIAAVRAECGELVSCPSPAGGFFLWLELRGGLEAAPVFEAAKRLGVAVTPGTGYYPDGGGERFFGRRVPGHARRPVGFAERHVHGRDRGVDGDLYSFSKSRSCAVFGRVIRRKVLAEAGASSIQPA